MDIQITSPAFKNQEMIPAKYTCDGQNISPPLEFTNIPEDTRTLALIVEDPDAPMGTFTHWITYNMPPDIAELPEALPDDETLMNGARQGINDFDRIGYGGPCPPKGTHRYYFRIYALNAVIDSTSMVNKQDIWEKMQGQIITAGELMGKYKRQ